jgi:hypothetical protein
MKTKRVRIRIIYYIILIIFIIGYIIYSFRNLHIRSKDLLVNHDTKIPAEYLSLLNLKDTSDIKPVINYVTKYRFPISLVDYKKKYTLIIYKIIDSLDIQITKVIHVNHSYSDKKTNVIYSIVNENHFELSFSSDTTYKLQYIELNLSGDSISNIYQSDTLVTYYLKFDQISWTKFPNKYLDIYIEPKDISPIAKKIPASISFIQHKGSLYFILLSVNDYSSYFEKEILQNLIIKTPKAI